MGEAINLVNNFKVEKVIFNCGSFNYLEKELIKVLDKKKIKYYSCIKKLNIDKNKRYFLQTKEYDNEYTANSVHYEVGKEVRDSIKRLGGTMPEDLPNPSKSLKELEKENNKLEQK